MVSRDDSEAGGEVREPSEPIRVYSPTSGQWVYSNDELDPRIAAEMDRDWRAMTPARKAKALAAAILVLSPILAVFAMIPFALFGPPETAETLEPIMAKLFIAQFALFFLIFAVSRFFPKKKGESATEP